RCSPSKIFRTFSAPLTRTTGLPSRCVLNTAPGSPARSGEREGGRGKRRKGKRERGKRKRDREEGREGGKEKEKGREGGREGRRDEEREGRKKRQEGREGRRDKEGGREGKEAGREGERERRREVRRERGGREAEGERVGKKDIGREGELDRKSDREERGKEGKREGEQGGRDGGRKKETERKGGRRRGQEKERQRGREGRRERKGEQEGDGSRTQSANRRCLSALLKVDSPSDLCASAQPLSLGAQNRPDAQLLPSLAAYRRRAALIPQIDGSAIPFIRPHEWEPEGAKTSLPHRPVGVQMPGESNPEGGRGRPRATFSSSHQFGGTTPCRGWEPGVSSSPKAEIESAGWRF
ncbi:Octapeptide-repeat protein T2, partial [Ophiophagus hannah]